jgi:hypothetical protein
VCGHVAEARALAGIGGSFPRSAEPTLWSAAPGRTRGLRCVVVRMRAATRMPSGYVLKPAIADHQRPEFVLCLLIPFSLPAGSVACNKNHFARVSAALEQFVSTSCLSKGDALRHDRLYLARSQPVEQLRQRLSVPDIILPEIRG